MAVSTWISNATNSTFNASVSTFSFHDALSIVPADQYPPIPFLFKTGCTQEDGSQNCTAACLDYNQIFGGLETLHNCMVYPTVADLFARRNLSNVDLAQQLNIKPSRMESPLYNNITTTIQNCLIDFCETLPGCHQALNEFNSSYSPSNITSAFYIYLYNADDYGSEYNFWDFCDYVPQSFNPDIGGIGVYVSYWIQTGLALLSFVLVVWLNWGIYYICFGALLIPRGYSEAKKIAQRIRNKSRNKHLPSLTGALAEFQKAQCFFMMAINVAALVNRNSGGFQPNSLQQLYNTYVLVKCISISGYLPVTFTLFTLHLVDVVSWYLLVLSIVTVIVSIATLFVIGSFSPSQKDMDYLSQQAITGGPVSCGLHNPAVYCFRPIDGAYGDSTDPASGAYSILAFCLVVLVLLVAHQYHAFKDPLTGRPKPWLSKVLEFLFQKGERSLRWVQIGLAMVSIGLSSYGIVNGTSPDYAYFDDGYMYGSGQISITNTPAFVLFTSCWTFSFVLYLMLTSASAHTRSDKPIGRFFSRKIALAIDFLSAVFWFAAFIAFAQSIGVAACGDGPCGLVVTNIIVEICACITFIMTTVLAARHMIRTRSERSERHTYGKRYWMIQRLRDYRTKRRSTEKTPLWKYVTRKVSSWKEVLRRSPPWTRNPFLTNRYIRLQHNTLPTMMSLIRRFHQDVKSHASVLESPSTMTSAAVVSMYLLFCCLYIYWFAVFIKDLGWFAHNGVSVDSWSFGQVVAITVWAEPLCEYFHLELRGMKRGFEHRLWGYQVVKIKQPDAKIGIVSDPTSSDRSPSPADSLENLRPSDCDKVKVVQSSGPSRNGEDFDQDRGDRINPSHEELRRKPVPEPRETSNDAEEYGEATEWQIPETVFLTSESISPF